MPSQSETPSTKDEKNAPPKLEEPCEVASSSMGLFAPPPPTHQMLSSNNSSPKQSFSRPPRPQSGDLRREKTLVTANKSERQENYHLGVDEEDGTKDCDLDISPTLKNRETAVISNTSGSTESTPLLHDSYLQGLFNGPPSPPNSLKSLGSLNSQDETPKIGEKRKTAPQNLSTQSQTSHRPTRSSLPPIQELASRGSARTLGSSPFGEKAADSTLSRVKKIARNSANGCLQPSFWIGSFMFLLYHIVFCLTMGSTIIRPHGKVIIGVMAKMAAVGKFWATMMVQFTPETSSSTSLDKRFFFFLSTLAVHAVFFYLPFSPTDLLLILNFPFSRDNVWSSGVLVQYWRCSGFVSYR